MKTLAEVLRLLDGNELTASMATALEPVAAFAMAKASLSRQLRARLTEIYHDTEQEVKS